MLIFFKDPLSQPPGHLHVSTRATPISRWRRNVRSPQSSGQPKPSFIMKRLSDGFFATRNGTACWENTDTLISWRHPPYLPLQNSLKTDVLRQLPSHKKSIKSRQYPKAPPISHTPKSPVYTLHRKPYTLSPKHLKLSKP